MPTETHSGSETHYTLAQIAREQHLQLIVRKGLPPFRQTALELTKALGEASPDLKKAAKLISADPTLSSQVLRMCNSPLLGLRSRVISIDHAATLLGPDRLRSLAVATSVADFAGKTLPEAHMSAFWQHSLMSAMLSQFLAERWEYFEKQQAYIAGLLHDIGQIPEWVLLSENGEESATVPSDWVDNISVEQEFFGTDHCKLGSVMARSWELMPSFLDVLENHHTPEQAQRDSVLVRIVATADNFLARKTQAASAEGQQPMEEAKARFEQLGQGLFSDNKWPSVSAAFELEYTRILPIAKGGLKGILGASGQPSERDSARVVTNAKADEELRLASPLPRASVPANHTFSSRLRGFLKKFFA